MKRMKAIATTLLLAALAGSVISWPFRQNFWGGLLFAAFEASLVGALADWFAVVALFRHPLGLKFIPHTAIISSNRNRIIDTITDVVENQWFNIEILKAKINNYPLIDKLASILKSDAGRQQMEEFAASLVPNIIRDISPEYAAQFLHDMVREHFSEVKVSPEVIERLETSLKSLYADDVVDFFLDKAIEATSGQSFKGALKRTLRGAVEEYSSKGGFLRRISRGIGESFDVINYHEAAESVAHQIREFLVGVRQPGNFYRGKIMTALDDVKIADPENSSAVLGSLLEKVLLTGEGFQATVEVLNALKAQLTSGDMENSPLVKYLANIVVEQSENIRTDEEKKAKVEGWIKGQLIALVDKYHGIVGAIVRENLQALNDESFVESLEDKVGDDLQWIRVNGTVIGLLVGVAQYLILHLL